MDASFPRRNKSMWDLLMVMFLLYTTFAVPYMIAFVDSSDPRVLTPFDIWDIFLDCLFMTDIIINFCTAYYNQGEYVTDLKRIALNYITSWFPLDFAGSFPFDKVVGVIVLNQGSGGTDLSFMKAFRIVRMLKLIRAVRLMVGPDMNPTSLPHQRLISELASMRLLLAVHVQGLFGTAP
jgi:hypothetical protein